MVRLRPEERANLQRLLDRTRTQIKRQRRSGRVDPNLIGELGPIYQDLENRGEYVEALKVVEVAFQGLRYVKHQRARQELSYRFWRAKGVTSLWLGRHGDSIEAYEKAIEFGEKGAYANEKPRMPATNRRELGSMYWRVGDHSEALRNLSSAKGNLERDRAAIHEPEYLDELARIRAAFSLVYLDLGRYTDAAESATEAAQIHEELGAQYPQRYAQAAIAYTTLGNTCREAAQELEADLGPAFAAFDDALRILKSYPSEDEEYTDRLSDIYLGLGRTLLLEAEYETALQNLERSLSFASDKNIAQHAAAHYLYVGEAQAKSGRTDAGETSLQTAADLAESYGSPETRWRALYELAVLQDADGRTLEAQDTLERCIATIEGLRAQYLPEPFKISMLAAKEKAYEAMVKNLCQSAETGPVEEAPQKILEAFGYAEAAKSRVFAEQLATTNLGVLAGVPKKLLEKEHSLTRELRVMRTGHLKALTHGTFDWGDAVARIEGRLKKIRKDMRKTPRGEEYVSLREAATLDYSDVRAILNSGSGGGSARDAEPGTRVLRGRTILAAYFVTDEEVFVFVGSPDLEAPRFRRVALTRDQLREWAFAIENTDADDLESWDLERWQRELGPLVEPLEELGDEADLIWMVPHAELHLLPLHALKIGDRYLAERNPVVYSPSASVMSYCRAKPTSSREEALVLGDSLPAPNNLVYAREEADTVARLFSTEPLLGERATKLDLIEKLRELQGKLSVLHVACHGEFDHSDPLRSRIKLASALGDGSADGSPDLSAEEVLGLNVEAGLVALSACASGVSERRAGDELIGMVRSFLYAGAPSMVVGLWYVADRSTRLLMERFYRSLLDGHGEGEEKSENAAKAEALQRAQQYVMQVEGFEHPYFWAPFVLIGEWR